MTFTAIWLSGSQKVLLESGPRPLGPSLPFAQQGAEHIFFSFAYLLALLMPARVAWGHVASLTSSSSSLSFGQFVGPVFADVSSLHCRRF